MPRAICLAFAVAALTTAALAQVGQESRGSGNADQARKTLDTYCVGCHNSRTKTGGVAFDALDLHAVHEHPDIWEAALRKLRGRQMPPPGNRQPDQREIDAFVSWMETTLDAAPPGPGSQLA